MTSIKYALDTDVFIQAARSYYAFDIVPSFWEALIQQAQNGKIISIDRVKTEIDRGKDQLMNWAGNDFHHHFQSTDQDETVEVYGRLMNWAYSQPQFTDSAKNEFAQEDNADPWLVAHAVVCNERKPKDKLLVVTQEIFESNIKRKIKIPNVCQAFKIECINVFQMLRALGIRLG